MSCRKATHTALLKLIKLLNLHEVQLPAQAQDPHAARHVRKLLCGDSFGQDDQKSVDDHRCWNADEKSKLVIAGDAFNHGVDQKGSNAHDSGTDAGQQEGGLYFLAVA